MAELVSKQKSKKWIIFVIIGVVLVAGLVFAAFFISGAVKRTQYNREIEMANKYFDDMEYEEAAAHYIAAIEINPKTFTAYVGVYESYVAAADVAIAKGDIGKAKSYYEDAIEVLASGADYFESDEREAIEDMIEDLENRIASTERIHSGAWDEITFGSYNGKSVEWIILSEDSDSMLIMSKYGFVAPSEDCDEEYAIWQDSKLRKYLNESFINELFNDNEKERIQISTVDNEIITSDLGDTTRESLGTVQDKIYVLSVSEFEQLFPIDGYRINGLYASSHLAITCLIGDAWTEEEGYIKIDKDPEAFEMKYYGAEYLEGIDYYGMSWTLRDVSPNGTEGLTAESIWMIDGMGSTHPYMIGCGNTFRPVIRISK